MIIVSMIPLVTLSDLSDFNVTPKVVRETSGRGGCTGCTNETTKNRVTRRTIYLFTAQVHTYYLVQASMREKITITSQ